MPSRADHTTVVAAGREVRLSNPGKVYFPALGLTKLELCAYYLEVAGPALRHLAERPAVLKRYVDGIGGEPFFQKRVPPGAPEWLQTATVRFPSGRTAREVVIADAAHLAWAVNLGTIDMNPWPVRRADLERPDELRIDLDPGPEVPFADVRTVALVVRDVLEEHGLTGFPKTSGSRGMHVYARVRPEHGFHELRRAGLALAREVERRAPALATTRWWKEERHGVFIDYNQNARDRTVASAYSVRPVEDAKVSCPLRWDEVPGVEPGDLTVRTVPVRLRTVGDPSEGIDAAVGRLTALLALAERDEAGGLGDAPWPPHFAKGAGEPARVRPGRARAGP